jgi:octaprenyl-diphosphate synthase
MLQLQKNYRLDTSPEDHLRICWHKTGHLFSGCGRLGAILGKANQETETCFADYGVSLGMAFQLVDDLLDYTSNQEVLGKPVLKDLEEGTITLPLIHLMEKASREECDFVREVVASKAFTDANKCRIMDLVRSYDTVQETKALARRHITRAQDLAREFPPSVYRDALLDLPELIINRRN